MSTMLRISWDFDDTPSPVVLLSRSRGDRKNVMKLGARGGGTVGLLAGGVPFGTGPLTARAAPADMEPLGSRPAKAHPFRGGVGVSDLEEPDQATGKGSAALFA
jgi:hypothetical protein